MVHRARSATALSDAAVSGAVAMVVSGAPSTVHALVSGADPLQASLAAGSLILPRETRRGHLLVAATVVHAALSLGWALVLAVMLPRRFTTASGAAAALGIAALDLGVVGRRNHRIRALPTAPQLADHLAYGAVVGAVLARRRGRRSRRRSVAEVG